VLFRRHVATLEIAEDVTAGELAVFFRCLHGLRSGTIGIPPEEYLIREGIRGIRLSPVNYKEVLSRGILATEASAKSEPRQEALWRTLLSAHLPTEGDERRIIEELSEVPELLPLIMNRALAAAGEPAPPSVPGSAPGFIPPDVLRRMFRRLGLALKALPAKQRKDLLGVLVEGVAPPGTEAERPVPAVPLAIARSMAEGYSDREFLELLASLLSLEEKGGGSGSSASSRSSPPNGTCGGRSFRSSARGAGRTCAKRNISPRRRGRRSRGSCSIGGKRRMSRKTTRPFGEALHLPGEGTRSHPRPGSRPPVLRRGDPPEGPDCPGGAAPFGETGP